METLTPHEESNPDAVYGILNELGFTHTPQMDELVAQIRVVPVPENETQEDPALEQMIAYQEQVQAVVDAIQSSGTSTSGVQNEWFASLIAIMTMFQRTGRTAYATEYTEDVLQAAFTSGKPAFINAVDQLVSNGVIDSKTVEDWKRNNLTPPTS